MVSTIYELLQEICQNDYKIYDMSDKNLKQIGVLIQLCQQKHDIIVFIKRNPNTERYFTLHDNLYNNQSNIIQTFRSEIVIFHKDNFVNFYEDTIQNIQDEKTYRMQIVKNLLDDNMCCICYNCSKEKTNFTMTLCENCSSTFCMSCLVESYLKIEERKCPVCKNQMNIQLVNTC
jgi:hypothetical protein